MIPTQLRRTTPRRSLIPWAAAWLVVCSLGRAPASAQSTGAVPAAAARSFALNWVRAPGAEACISSQSLARALEQMLGPVFERPAEAEFAIEGVVARAADVSEWRAHIVIAGAHGDVIGKRELRSVAADCHALDPQVVLVIALAIDPEVALRGMPADLLEEFSTGANAAEELLAELRAEHAEQAAETKRNVAPPPATVPLPPTPAPAQSSEPASHPADTAAPNTDRRASAAWHVEPQLALGFALGIVPGPTAGAGLGVRLQSPAPWSFALNAMYWLPRSASATEVGLDGSVAFYAAQSTLALCRVLLDSARWQWSGCAGPTTGVRWADADALPGARTALRLYVAPTASTGVRYLSRPWFFGATLAAGVMLWEDRFSYELVPGNRIVLFETPVLAGWAELALGARL